MPKSNQRDIFSSWVWALPLMLLVAALSISQVDRYPPMPDEFFSMVQSGWMADGPYSPAEIVGSLRTYTPEHTPLYFLLFGLWGELTANAIALGRVLSILLWLLFMALAYRLAQDVVGEMAGLFALVYIGGCAFFNFYIPHARMYTLLALLTACALWLYQRIAYRRRPVFSWHYALLGGAVLCMLATHAFSALFLLMLGMYHLFLVPKDRRWWRIAIVVSGAALLFSPYLLETTATLETVAIERAQFEVAGVLRAWFTLTLNGQPLLLLLPIVGFVCMSRSRRIGPAPWLLMIPMYDALMALLEALSGFIEISGMRYHIAGWLLMALGFAAGLRGLYHCRKWLAVLALLLWLLAGLHFQRSTSWWRYLTALGELVASPPTQVISRMAQAADPAPAILGLGLSPLHRYYLRWDGDFGFPISIDYSQEEHYFGRHGIRHHAADDMANFADHAHRYAPSSPALWLYDQPQRTEPNERAEADAIIASLNYELCRSDALGNDTLLEEYAWRTLGCSPMDAPPVQSNAIMDYQFHGAGLNVAGDRLYFSDRWSGADERLAKRHSMSYQLLNLDWENVAQLDLPLVQAGQLRMYFIDVSALPPGGYRLAAIVYDRESGERLAWRDNPGPAPAMLFLHEAELE